MPLSTSLISSPGFINIAITYLDCCTTRSARDTGRHLPSFWLAYVLLSHWALKLLSGLRIPFTVYLRISEQHRSTCLFCSVFPDVCLSPLRDSVIHTTLIKKKKKRTNPMFFFLPSPDSGAGTLWPLNIWLNPCWYGVNEQWSSSSTSLLGLTWRCDAAADWRVDDVRLCWTLWTYEQIRKEKVRIVR